MSSALSTSFPRHAWSARLAQHTMRFESWALARRGRAGVAQKHPVYDFLFDYYSSRPSQLMRWSPGVDVFLEGASRESFSGAAEFEEYPDGLILRSSSFPLHRRRYLEWAIHYLTRTAERPAQLSCFGLHEWAMVFRSSAIRYPDIPLRLPASEIEDLCLRMGLRCTHFDAFRFFTPEAAPLNSIQLTRAETTQHDQPGCIHVSMDLYRFAYKIAPFIPSDLTGDAFELAAAAREIDMRASPYDLSAWGFSPIRIEEISGRAEYAALQLELSQRAAPVRERILAVYQGLLSALPHSEDMALSPSETLNT